MAERATITLQQGIWIDKERLAVAGLQDPLEITVYPGEIRIRTAELDRVSADDGADEPLFELAGLLSGSPLSAEEIERELYGDEAGQK